MHGSVLRLQAAQQAQLGLNCKGRQRTGGLMRWYDTPIETERLILRAWEPGRDFERHAEMMADPLSALFITVTGKPEDRNLAWRSLAMLIGHQVIRGFTMFAVEEKATGQWVGRCGPWRPEGWPELEIGWALHPDARGKGYAREAAQACLQAMWTAFPAEGRFFALIDADNVGSQNVARKIGMQLTEVMQHPTFGPLQVWAVSRP